MSRGTKDVVHTVQVHRQNSLIRTPPPNQQAEAAAPRADYDPVPPARKESTRRQPDGLESGGGQGVAVSSDRLIDELQTRLNKQRTELENRTDNVNAIQRNFQRLSEMYSSDRQKLTEAEEQLRVAWEELSSLRAEKKLFVALRSEFATLQSTHDELLSSHKRQVVESSEAIASLKLRVTSAEKDCTMLRRVLQEAQTANEERVDSERRMTHVLCDLETHTNTLLLGLLELQKSTLPHASPLVGDGISFVAAADSKQSVAGNQPSLRVEVAAKALELAGNKAVRVVSTTLAVKLRSFEEELQAKAQLHDGEIEEERKRRRDVEDRLTTSSQLVEQLQRRLHEVCAQLETERRDRQTEMSQIRSGADSERAESAQLFAKCASLADQIHLLQTQLEECERAKRAAERSAQDAQSTAALAGGTLSQQLDAATKEMASLRNQVETERAAAAAAALKLRQQCDTLEAARLDAERRCKQLTEQHEHLKQSEGRATSSKIFELEQQLRTQGEALASLRDVKVLYDQLYTDHEQLKARAAANGESVVKLRLELDLREETVSELTMEVATQKISNRQFQEQVQTLEESLKDVGGELDVARLELLEVSKARGEMELKWMYADAELRRQADATRVNEGLTLRQKRLEGELCELKESLLNAHGLSQALQTKITELERANDIADRRAASATMEADTLRCKQASFDTQRRELEEQSSRAASRARHLRVLQEETARTINKVLAAEKACESGYSCQHCLQLLRDPVMCAPCGHVYCRKCLQTDTAASSRDTKKTSLLFCPECDMNNVAMLVPNKAMDMLSGKFQYRCQVLNDLSILLEKELCLPQL